jgi:hypothetical protein
MDLVLYSYFFLGRKSFLEPIEIMSLAGSVELSVLLLVLTILF